MAFMAAERQFPGYADDLHAARSASPGWTRTIHARAAAVRGA